MSIHLLLLATILSLLSLPILGLGLAPSPTSPPQNLTNSLHAIVNNAMNEALNSLQHIKLHQPNSTNAAERAALSDCSEFYELIVDHLNQTLDPNLNPTAFDVQIWLSAALTNLDNCITTMSEQKVARPLYLLNDASELISNGLAVNAELMKGETGGQNYDLHRWFPGGDFFMDELGLKSSVDLVVAKDKSGNYRTIKEALDASRRRKGKVVIHIKKGVYDEIVEIGKDMKNIVFIGDGIGKTVITGDRSARSGFSTRDSAIVRVMGDGFTVRDLTIRNTAGADGGQAVALLSSSDRSAYYRCSFEGYQDTLWVNSNRQFFQECHIYGTIDFIFGNAAAVIDNSFIYARAPLHGQQVVITAHGRSEPIQPTGIVIMNSKFQPDPAQREAVREFKAYLGRPWRSYARTVYLKCFLDGMVDPSGWAEWMAGDVGRTRTVYYGEYRNYGPGSRTEKRVKWRGFRVIRDGSEAEKFGVERFIGGQAWLPSSGVPFSSGIA